MKKFNYRLAVFVLLWIFGIGLSLPSFLNIQNAPKITLGLDLQGGLYILLGVDTKKAIESKIKSLASSISYFTEDEEILIEDMKIDKNKIVFTLVDEEDKKKIEEFLKKNDGISISKDNLHYTISLTPKEIESIKEYAINQAVDTIRNRLDQYGLAEPNVAKQGKDKILVEIAGVKTQEEEHRIRALIAKAAHLQLMAVDEENAAKVYTLSNEEAKELGDIILNDVNNPKT